MRFVNFNAPDRDDIPGDILHSRGYFAFPGNGKKFTQSREFPGNIKTNQKQQNSQNRVGIIISKRWASFEKFWPVIIELERNGKQV